MNDKYIVDLVAAGLEGNTSKVELIASELYRSLRKENPSVSNQIKHVLSEFSFHGQNFIRKNAHTAPPMNADTHMDLVKILPPNLDMHERPVFNETINAFIDEFIEERNNGDRLMSHGMNPSNSILLIGLPGTGKTMLARYLASAINKPLITLDLSTSISSLLGKTGENLKKVLDFAKNSGAVLLLDEFDAIAKKRDDVSELGEIKRIVNVLLMEMENWPASSVLIATSNHPELLDRAVWRRFDHVLNVPIPDLNQRTFLLNRELDGFLKNKKDGAVVKLMGEFLSERSASDICRIAKNIKRKIIIREETFQQAAIRELCAVGQKKDRGRIASIARDVLGNDISVRELADLTGLSSSGVQHHLKK